MRAVAQHAGRAHVARQPRVDRAHLLELVHRGAVDLLLRVEAGAHHPLVREVEQAAALVEAQRLGVRQHVERGLERHAQLEQAVLGRPGPVHRLLVDGERLARSRRSSGGVTQSGRRVSVSVSSGREAGTMRCRWSWLSAVCESFFRNV